MNTETHARINNPREREKNVSYQKGKRVALVILKDILTNKIENMLNIIINLFFS